MEIAIDYRYGDTIAGIRPDTGGTAGRTAQLVVKATTCDVAHPEVWWQGEVAYPLAGMMMAPGKMFRQMEYHLKIEETDGTHYYTFSQPLDALNDKGLSTAVYATTGGIHGASQPIWQSLVIQQAKMLTYDPTTDTETVSQLLWEEETAADFDQHLLQARHAWTMARQPSTLRTATDHPLYFPATTETRVGGGELHALTPHLRRSADGLFGDGQFDAFCSDGIYLLRQNGGRWRAQQSIQRTSLLPDTLPLAVEGGTVFLTARGVMLLKGSEAKCLSDSLGDAPFSPLEGRVLPWSPPALRPIAPSLVALQSVVRRQRPTPLAHRIGMFPSFQHMGIRHDHHRSDGDRGRRTICHRRAARRDGALAHRLPSTKKMARAALHQTVDTRSALPTCHGEPPHRARPLPRPRGGRQPYRRGALWQQRPPSLATGRHQRGAIPATAARDTLQMVPPRRHRTAAPHREPRGGEHLLRGIFRDIDISIYRYIDTKATRAHRHFIAKVN